MPIWSFGRGVLGFFEALAGTRGVVSFVGRGEFEASILLSLASLKEEMKRIATLIRM